MSEHDEQAALISWAGWNAGRWPELSSLYAIPNGGKRDALTGERMRREGVRPGFPDLGLPIPRGSYHGLFLELKTQTGRCSKAQLGWHHQLARHGYLVVVARGWQQAADALQAYLSLPEREAA